MKGGYIFSTRHESKIGLLFAKKITPVIKKVSFSRQKKRHRLLVVNIRIKNEYFGFFSIVVIKNTNDIRSEFFVYLERIHIKKTQGFNIKNLNHDIFRRKIANVRTGKNGKCHEF